MSENPKNQNAKNAKKVAVFYVATGKYLIFWPDFLASCEQFLLPGCAVHYFVFTDADAVEGEDGVLPAWSPKALAALGLSAPPAGAPAQDPATLAARVHYVKQEALAWPYSTLMRFGMFEPLLPRLESEGFDCAYFLNANYLCARTILPAEFLPDKENAPLVFCRHPGYYAQKPPQFPYDRNPKSTACIPYNRGRVYVCGGTNGGALSAYGALIRVLAARVDTDLSHHIIARWHDESQLNRFAVEQEGQFKLLSPAFCRPEGWRDFPWEPAFLVREKSNWLDVAAVKSTPPAEGGFVRRKLKNLWARVSPWLFCARDTLLGKK